MKSKILFLTMFWILLINAPCVHALSPSAQFCILTDADTGRIIYEKNKDTKHPMASTTKIMTALLALENCALTDTVTVSKKAANTEGTSLYLKAGEHISMEDLLYGLMLQSGNDAAVAIAEHISGTTEKFAELMCARAESMGLCNTSFETPNGLDGTHHYTTAYDLAQITRLALKNDIFHKIVASQSYKLAYNGKTIYNHNKMLRYYKGCIGVKTGFTKKAGRCLVSAAERNGVRLICVTLNAPNDWQDHTALLDYGFANTIRFPLIAKGMTINTVTVENGNTETVEVTSTKDIYITEDPQQKFKNVQVITDLPSTVKAPIAAGDIIGTLEVLYNGQAVENTALIANADVAAASPHVFDKSVLNYLKKLLLCGCVSLSFGV